MKGNGGGMIMMSSVVGMDAWAGIYSSSKFAIMGLINALADEGRPYGMKVCAICPGVIADELVDDLPEVIAKSQKISPFDVTETASIWRPLGLMPSYIVS